MLRDDDGGEATRQVGKLQVQTPVAVWANSPSLTRSLNWGGAEGNIEGRVHTNGLLRFVGAKKTVLGGTTYAGAIAADTTRNSFVPAPARRASRATRGFPAGRLPAGRPGLPGDRHGLPRHAALCASGSWHEVQAVLADGAYYAPCPIQAQRIRHRRPGDPGVRGHHQDQWLAAGLRAVPRRAAAAGRLEWHQGDRRGDVPSKFAGVIFAGSGEISISGAKNRFFCGILGDRVDITGGDTDIRGAVCGRPDTTVSGPVLVPELAAELAVDRDAVLPSQTLGYDLSVTNEGATLVAPALIGLENIDAVQETITGYSFSLERLDAATGVWSSLAPAG